MIGQPEVTQDEELLQYQTDVLDELCQCRRKLGAIAGWVAFMGIVLLLGIGLTMCNAVLGMG